jgi:BioD-like phosphotransacetylase family protein
MKSILIASTEEHAGKSVLCLSIGLSLKKRGTPFCYMKPISYEVSYETGVPIDRDAETIRTILELEDSVQDIAPVPLEGPFLREAIESGDRGFRQRILSAFNRMTEDRQIALIEGRHYVGLGISAGLSDVDLALLLSADILILSHYDGEETIDRILCALRHFESAPRILGVIFNDVSMDTQFSLLNDVFVPFLADRGAEVLGIIPSDLRLRSVSVSEIMKRLGGALLTTASTEQSVENFLVAAMGPEVAVRHFRRTPNLAVITGGDRTALHEIALETSNLRCLILTGNLRPSKETLAKAQEHGIPIILTGQNTLAAATVCESLLKRAWIKPGPVLDYTIDHFQRNIDIDRIIEKATRP